MSSVHSVPPIKLDPLDNSSNKCCSCGKDVDKRWCGVSGCFGYVGINQVYCYDHRCSFAHTSQNSCSNKRAKGKLYCEEHNCGFPFCFKHVYFNTPYCEDHACNYNKCCNSVSIKYDKNGKPFGNIYCFYHSDNDEELK